ncbi:MAG TPA: hypothetical protein VD886_19945, partial [Herpetosiphonaceae bacterium]|nr:hypothetical protein [Herpetosiphonaceae bacterium]
AWWSLQPGAAANGLTTLQILVGVLGFVVIPALAWAPAPGDDLLAELRQARSVARYAAQTQADLALLRATLLRAQALLQPGLASCTPEERAELATIVRELVGGMDRTLAELAGSVASVSGITLPHPRLGEIDAVEQAVAHVAAALESRERAPAAGIPPEKPAKAAREARQRAIPAPESEPPAPRSRRAPSAAAAEPAARSRRRPTR